MGIIAKPDGLVNRFSKINSYKTTSLVLDILVQILYNGEKQKWKRDEGMSTPICGQTESLYLLRKDRLAPEEYGSGAA